MSTENNAALEWEHSALPSEPILGIPFSYAWSLQKEPILQPIAGMMNEAWQMVEMPKEAVVEPLLPTISIFSQCPIDFELRGNVICYPLEGGRSLAKDLAQQHAQYVVYLCSGEHDEDIVLFKFLHDIKTQTIPKKIVVLVPDRLLLGSEIIRGICRTAMIRSKHIDLSLVVSDQSLLLMAIEQAYFMPAGEYRLSYEGQWYRRLVTTHLQTCQVKTTLSMIRSYLKSFLRDRISDTLSLHINEVHYPDYFHWQLSPLLATILPMSVPSLNESESYSKGTLDDYLNVLIKQLISLPVLLDDLHALNQRLQKMEGRLRKKQPDCPSIQCRDVRESKIEEKSECLSIEGVGYSESIAVLATACRLPGGIESAQDLYDTLRDHEYEQYDAQALKERRMYKPEGDMSVAAQGTSTYFGYFIEDVDYFDHEFFRLSLTQAQNMDPQCRHLLEVCAKAIYNAGYDLKSIQTPSVGIFAGHMNEDWRDLVSTHAESPLDDSTHSMSHQLAEILQLTGPRETVKAEAGSLIALDRAIIALREQRCDLALVCGVNLILSERSFQDPCIAPYLSNRRCCYVFDQQADGYCRAEGVAAVLIGLSSKVPRNREILALIKGSASYDVSAIHPHQESAATLASEQSVNLLAQALKEGRLDAVDLDYFECHGSGVSAQDAMEINALKQVAAKKRKKPLVVGSLKSYLGHAEGASGLISLIYTIEVMLHRQALGIARLQTLNPNIDINDFNVVLSPRSFSLPAQSVKAGISALGQYSCAHIVLETPESYSQLGVCDLPPVPHTPDVFLGPRKHPSLEAASQSARPRTLMVFSGQCQLDHVVIRTLYQQESQFKSALDHYLSILCNQGIDVRQELLSNQTQHSQKIMVDWAGQPVLVALQLALLDWWKHRGVLPDAVIGCDIGEYSAAVAAQVLSPTDALTMAIYRGQFIYNCDQGAMAELSISAENIRWLPDSIYVSAEYGPSHTIISGPQLRLHKFLEICYPNQYRILDATYALNSPILTPAANAFREVMQHTSLSQGVDHVQLYSTVTGDASSAQMSHLDYWVKQITSPVKYWQAIKTLSSQRMDIEHIVEVGSDSTLISITQPLLPGRNLNWTSSMK